MKFCTFFNVEKEFPFYHDTRKERGLLYYVYLRYLFATGTLLRQCVGPRTVYLTSRGL